MYFYVYKDKLYWGRYQLGSTRFNPNGWIFRNKPARLNHWYISGDYKFIVDRLAGYGLWIVHVSYKDGSLHNYSLVSGRMYHLSEGWHLSTIDRHQVARNDTERQFKNRLKEYRDRYFLPFHRHIRCV